MADRPVRKAEMIPAWPGWSSLPARKPLAVGSVLYTAGVILWYVWHGTDVPPGIVGLIETLVYVCVGGYVASSAYEAVRVQNKGGEESWREERKSRSSKKNTSSSEEG